MIKKFTNMIYVLFIISFLILINIFYFSNENIKNTNKIRSNYTVIDKSLNLPLLKNDTNNIIEYTDDIKQYIKKKKKYKFFDLIENSK